MDGIGTPGIQIHIWTKEYEATVVPIRPQCSTGDLSNENEWINTECPGKIKKYIFFVETPDYWETCVKGKYGVPKNKFQSIFLGLRHFRTKAFSFSFVIQHFSCCLEYSLQPWRAGMNNTNITLTTCALQLWRAKCLGYHTKSEFQSASAGTDRHESLEH
jgi:hypothetical protein